MTENERDNILYPHEQVINYLFKNDLEIYLYVLGFLIGMRSSFVLLGVTILSVQVGLILGAMLGGIVYFIGRFV